MHPDALRNIRNVLIILALATGVWLLPGGAATGNTVYTLLLLVFTIGMLFFGYRLYMENKAAIFSLGDRMRAVLYGSVALAAIVLIATPRLWASGVGIALWVALIGIAGWGCYTVYRAYRSY